MEQISNNKKTKKAVHIENVNNWFSIQWGIGSKCNMHCSYCCAGKTAKNLTQEECMATVPYLNKLFEKCYKASGKYCQMHISGVEPTLWDICEIFDAFDYTYLKDVSIISNGTAPVETYRRLREIVESHGSRFVMTFSYHEQEDVKAFVDKAIESLCTKINVVIADVEKWGHLYRQLAEEQKRIQVEATIVRVENSRVLATPDRQEIAELFFDPASREKGRKKIYVKFDDGSEEMMNQFQYSSEGYDCDFTGYNCYAGTNKLQVRPTGKIFRGGRCTWPSIGNLYDIDDFEVPTKPFTCTGQRLCNLCSAPKIIRKDYDTNEN